MQSATQESTLRYAQVYATLAVVDAIKGEKTDAPEAEFVKKVLALYEVWRDGCEPTPSFEVVLEWIERDRMEARDYVEAKARAELAEAVLDKLAPVLGLATLIFPEGTPITDGRGFIGISEAYWYAMREALGELES